MHAALRDRLHTVLVTDGRGDVERCVAIVQAALAGGIQCVQIREPQLGARALAEMCTRLQPDVRAHDALLLVNDRADVATAGFAQGVHLGGRALVPAELPFADLVRGASVHNAAELARSAGADYILVSPLFPTSCKPGAVPLGPEGAQALISRATVPAVLLGGIHAGNAPHARSLGATGIAVMGAICSAPNPEATARELVATRSVGATA